MAEEKDWWDKIDVIGKIFLGFLGLIRCFGILYF